MKNNHLCLLAAAFMSMFAICSCEKPEPEKTTLTVDPTTIEAPGLSKENFKVTVTTTGPWSASSNAEFVTISPKWGTGTGELVVTVDKNRTDEPRKAEVTVVVEGVGESIITVNQEAGVIETVGQRKFYVKVNGAEDADGLTWDTATTFEKAYGEAVEGETINFAAGTYVPKTYLPGTDNSEARNVTFYLDKNITLVGGFPESPKMGDASDPKANETVLSGKISENASAFHVVVVAAPIVDGGQIIGSQGIYHFRW